MGDTAKGYLGLPIIPRDDFNRIAQKFKGAACWSSDEVNPGVVDPDEIILCNPHQGQIDKYVKSENAGGLALTKNFDQQYRKVAELYRQELVKKELAKARVVTLTSNLNDYKLTPAQKKMVAAILQVGNLIDELYQKQQGVDRYKKEVLDHGTADDKTFLQRYQSPWCEDPVPYCTAVSSLPPFTNPLYPEAVDCKALKDELANPFSVVRQMEGGALQTIPYAQAPELQKLTALLFIALKNAADKAREAGENGLAEYMDEVANALRSDKPYPYVKADEKWVASKDSKFFLRVGPDEVSSDKPCHLRAQYQLLLGIKDPAPEKAIQKTMERKQDFENYLGGLIPGYQPRAVVVETPEFVNVIMENGWARGTLLLNAIGQTLPNWCGEDGKTECKTRALQFTNKMKAAYSKDLAKKFGEIFSQKIINFLDMDYIADITVDHELSHNFGPQMKDYKDKLGDLTWNLEEFKAQIGAIALRPFLETLGFANPATRNNEYAALLGWCFGQIRRASSKGEKFYETGSPYVLLSAVMIGYFMEQGVLTYSDGKWDADFDKLPAAAKSLYTLVGSLYLRADPKEVEAFYMKYTSGEGLKYLHLDRINETIAKVPTVMFDFKVKGL